MEKVILKISGELFISTEKLNLVIEQIKEISSSYQIGVVVGAGNIFRGQKDSKTWGLKQTTGDNAGMIATVINGLILKNSLENKNLKVKVLSALTIPDVLDNITQERINDAIDKKKIIIFVGGTGNPFFTTDTNAVLRALQMNAKTVLKGTKVNGIFNTDPIKNNNAQQFKKITFDDYLNKNLQVMDMTAITLAKKYKLKIKIFNIFEKNSLINILKKSNYGSIVS